jgi:CubicO group peptidase (beta-lactamase class C family)
MGRRDLALDGVHVASPGHPAVEHHWSPDERRDIFSASKSVTSMAIGIAAAEGLLALDDAVIAHLPQLGADAAPGVEHITIDHLLTMSSGIDYRWNEPDADHPDDPARDILSTALAAAPGTSFAYRGANTYLLSRVIHACTGTDLRDFLNPRLFQPLGIANPQWLRCPRGYSLGAVGLQLRTEELARIGKLLLDRGSWGEQLIIPADYIDAMTVNTVSTDGHVATAAAEPHPDNARYGRHVWMCARDGAWRMDGIYGQFGVILPNHQSCITVTAHYQGPTTDILDAMWADIVPALE